MIAEAIDQIQVKTQTQETKKNLFLQKIGQIPVPMMPYQGMVRCLNGLGKFMDIKPEPCSKKRLTGLSGRRLICVIPMKQKGEKEIGVVRLVKDEAELTNLIRKEEILDITFFSVANKVVLV